MPTSPLDSDAAVMRLLAAFQPSSILDVGVGTGRFGFLVRERLEGCAENPGRLDPPYFRLLLDGVEAFPNYLTPVHRLVYSHIFEADIRHIVTSLPKYDVIHLGDVLEHFSRPDGLDLMTRLYEKCERAVIIKTPRFVRPQDACAGNVYEVHKSSWKVSDFRKYPFVGHRCICPFQNEPIQLFVLAKEPRFVADVMWVDKPSIITPLKYHFRMIRKTVTRLRQRGAGVVS